MIVNPSSKITNLCTSKDCPSNTFLGSSDERIQLLILFLLTRFGAMQLHVNTLYSNTVTATSTSSQDSNIAPRIRSIKVHSIKMISSCLHLSDQGLPCTCRDRWSSSSWVASLCIDWGWVWNHASSSRILTIIQRKLNIKIEPVGIMKSLHRPSLSNP